MTINGYPQSWERGGFIEVAIVVGCSGWDVSCFIAGDNKDRLNRELGEVIRVFFEDVNHAQHRVYFNPDPMYINIKVDRALELEHPPVVNYLLGRTEEISAYVKRVRYQQEIVRDRAADHAGLDFNQGF